MIEPVSLDVDATNAALPPRSQLYHLRAAGLGTGMVEAITSYAMRLATSHLLTVGILLAQVLGPAIVGARSVRRAATTEVVAQARTANGVDDVAGAWVAALEASTLVDGLDALTLLRWAPLVPAVHLLGQTMRHCPGCLSEMADSGLVYEPLAWMLRQFKVCSTHGSCLRDACPRCGSVQPVILGTSRPGMCRRCDHWLGTPSPNAGREPSNWERFTSRGVLDLIAATPDRGVALDPSSTGAAIEAANAALGLNLKELARAAGVADGALSPIRRGLARGSLDTHLRICALRGWSLPDFLRGELRVTASPIPPAGESRKPRHHDWHAVAAVLTSRLAEPGPPISVAELARELGIDRKLLRQHLPDLCRSLDERRMRTIAERRDARALEAKALVESVTLELLRSGATASRRQVERLLPRPLSLREVQLQETWHLTRANWKARAA